jgi:hypothetical protein
MSERTNAHNALFRLVEAGWTVTIDAESVIIEQRDRSGGRCEHAYRHDATADGLDRAIERADGGGQDDNADVFGKDDF